MSVKCALVIAALKFRILQKPIEIKIKNLDHIIKSTCILHNVIIGEKNRTDIKKSLMLKK